MARKRKRKALGWMPGDRPWEKKCDKDWNKRARFHIDQARKDAGKATSTGCLRAAAHLDEARRTLDACRSPANLRKFWGDASRKFLASCKLRETAEGPTYSPKKARR